MAWSSFWDLSSCSIVFWGEKELLIVYLYSGEGLDGKNQGGEEALYGS